VALPLTTQNSLSQFQPEWQCWEPGTQWVRQPPADAITDPEYFSFYQPGMTFEQFVREFADWFSEKRPAAMMVGIRADESYNRFVAIANSQKQRFADDKPWTTAPRRTPGIFTRCMTGKQPISGRGLRNQNAV
jgi:predicted phosphoadenosine phosphosulfate sulfurtransferase